MMFWKLDLVSFSRERMGSIAQTKRYMDTDMDMDMENIKDFF
jgi:hypothetical protein